MSHQRKELKEKERTRRVWSHPNLLEGAGKQTSPILIMSGNVPTPMDVEDPKKTPKVSKIEELNTQREEFRKDSESLILEQLQRKAEMLEDKAAKASAKATFARTYYENEKRLIEKRRTTYQQRKKGKSILKTQRERLIQLHRAERDRKILARDTAEDLRKREEDE